ncbi:MAG: helix-turn-helix transcriptional regulator [Clostridiales Family XIII bacterium]|jgi:putative transcriptional regulator|nr:helix-turn-helix transcriptional regulator [Clostridiales Family XIII bacterium]
MVRFNIIELLEKNNRSKYWLCQQMNVTSRNMNRLISGKTSAISFKYIEVLCKLLDCRIEELITIIPEHDVTRRDSFPGGHRGTIPLP